jgi:hypothetical protein
VLAVLVVLLSMAVLSLVLLALVLLALVLLALVLLSSVLLSSVLLALMPLSLVMLASILLAVVLLSTLLLSTLLLLTLLSVLLRALLSVLLGVLLVVLEEDDTLVGVGALDELLISSALVPSLVLDTAEEVGEADEVDATEPSDITEVVLEVDKSDGTSGRPTVTAAVAKAVVLPSASTCAVTATTTSAFELVLMMLGNIAVP